jgi:hypothetical protein
MRPIKEIFLEEYWNIAFREAEENDYVFINKNKAFKTLKEDNRYWYADPFLFEYKNEIWLFAEAFDNKTEKGVIACMKYQNGGFSSPEVVLEEDFHLSYPYIYEENGEVFMMPETSSDGSIQIYKALDFPKKWVKHKTLINIENAVDTVIFGDKLVTSVVTDSYEKRVDVDVYDINTGEYIKSLHKNSQQARGAGRVFSADGKDIRPAQDCTNGVYGAGLVFYHIEETDDGIHEEKLYTLAPENFSASNKNAEGVHTYARAGNLEVLDFKRKRFNLRRILWIIQKKL